MWIARFFAILHSYDHAAVFVREKHEVVVELTTGEEDVAVKSVLH
jgi:hypothetical protein